MKSMAKNELMAKCQKLDKILSQNNSYDLNESELYIWRVEWIAVNVEKCKVCVRHYAICP